MRSYRSPNPINPRTPAKSPPNHKMKISSRTFENLKSKCDQLQEQLELTWSQAKTDTLLRSHTLKNILTQSKDRDFISYKDFPGYSKLKRILSEKSLAEPNTTYLSQKKLVSNILNESKDSLVPLKALFSPIICKLLAKRRRKFGEQLTQPCSISPVRHEAEHQDTSTNLLRSTLSARSLYEDIGCVSPNSQAGVRINSAKQLGFKSPIPRTKRNEPSSWITIHNQSSQNQSQEEDRTFKGKAIQRRVSQANSPKYRFPISQEQSEMYKEAESQLNCLKSRIHMERLVKEFKRKSHRSAFDLLKIIGPRTKKKFGQINY